MLENRLHNGKAMIALARVVNVSNVGTPELVILNDPAKALRRSKMKQRGRWVRIVRVSNFGNKLFHSHRNVTLVDMERWRASDATRERIAGIGGNIVWAPWFLIGICRVLDWISREQTLMGLVGPYATLLTTPRAFLIGLGASLFLVWYANRLERLREEGETPRIIRPFSEPSRHRYRWTWLKVALFTSLLSVLGAGSAWGWIDFIHLESLPTFTFPAPGAPSIPSAAHTLAQPRIPKKRLLYDKAKLIELLRQPCILVSDLGSHMRTVNPNVMVLLQDLHDPEQYELGKTLRDALIEAGCGKSTNLNGATIEDIAREVEPFFGIRIWGGYTRWSREAAVKLANALVSFEPNTRMVPSGNEPGGGHFEGVAVLVGKIQR